MRARILRTTAGLVLAIWAGLSLSLTAQTATPPPEVHWARELQAFAAADKTNPPPTDAVLFVGSSSIRFWTNLAQSFPGHKVINRGFGGSQLSDSVALMDRLILPYQPKLVLLYAGDNDIAAGKSPETVFSDFKAFVAKLHAALPRTPIVYIAIKPCPAREKFLDRVRAANRLIRDYTTTGDRLVFADIFTPMLTPKGQLRTGLWKPDGLHPNAACYELWASVLRPLLDRYDPAGSAAKPR